MEPVEGVIFDMSPPNRRHQEIVTFFTKTISNHINKNEGGCTVYPAPFAVFLKMTDESEGYENYVEPGISVICDSGKFDDKAVRALLIGLLILNSFQCTCYFCTVYSFFLAACIVS